jgi:coenzyme F420-reducing hydrogenase alpha subunit
VAIEGELTLRLAWDGQRVTGVDLRSTRPFIASRLFAGRTPADVVTMAPLLYSVCAHAHGVAAAGALEAATGRKPSSATIAARRLCVVLETIQEHLWRLLLDLPVAMGRAGEILPVAATRRAIAPILAALVPVARRIDGSDGIPADCDVSGLATSLNRIAAMHVYGAAPDAWLARADNDAIAAWAQGGETLPARLFQELLSDAPDLARSDVALMPAAQRGALAAAVLPALRGDPAFAQAPSWNGAPVETGALARARAHPFVAAIGARCGNAVPSRIAARLTELALLLGQLEAGKIDETYAPWADAFALDAGEALGAVQTARGLLLHYARIDGGRVVAYRIVAPTEWNFHPAGALAHGLAALAANDEQRLVREARLAVQALDPCVNCRVEVAHA